jgi:transketolase
MTHDSIGLGEDGPTHQPVEHLASLRAMPKVHVMRPADALETAECWELALERDDGPAIMALTRQGLPLLRETAGDENLSARGAYELRVASGGAAQVVLFASGSEIEIAVAAREQLQRDGVPTRVVSVPCWELFMAQDDEYKRALLGNETARVAVEAASPMGWEAFVGATGRVIGMTTFGASAPAKDLYAHFGITAEAVASAAKEQI